MEKHPFSQFMQFLKENWPYEPFLAGFDAVCRGKLTIQAPIGIWGCTKWSLKHNKDFSP